MMIQKLGQLVRENIINSLWMTAMICLLTIMPIANARSGWNLVWQGNLSGDKALTFFAEPGIGKLLFYDVKNLSSAGANINIAVEKNNTSDQLQVTFNGDMVEAHFLNDGSSVASGKQSDITCCTPFSVTIQDGKLTISIGEGNYTVDNVSAFKGNLTTQLLAGGVEAYR